MAVTRPAWRLERCLLVSCLLALPHTLGPAGDARAHSWYPTYCCDDRDCIKVDRIEYVTGGMYMTAGELRVFVPDSMEKRPSQDADAHICIMRTQTSWRLRCVFLPGTA